MNYITIIVLGVIGFFSIISNDAYAGVPSQTLMKGQSTTINLDYEVGDVAAADPGVCDYLIGQDRRSIYVNARSGGETTITLWDASGAKKDEFAVRVVTTTLKEVLDRAKNEFGELDGVKVNVRGGHVEIEGEVAEPEDFRKIEGAARADTRIRSRIRLSKNVIDQVADAIKGVVDVPGVTVRSVRDKVVLEGVAYSPADAKRAVEIAKLYSPDILDLIEIKETGRQVGRGKMIELKFHMMEVKKSALKSLGVNWAPGAQSGGASSQNGGGNGGGLGVSSMFSGLVREVFGFVMQFIPKLKTMNERGDGRVLENPSVIVKSGEEAKIFSGSEIPYYKGQDVQFKKIGIDITATPIEVQGGVDIKLTANLSAPSADMRGSIDTQTVSTSAICPVGQSMVLANIIRSGDVKMKNRVPREIDTSSALFTLFKSKDFQSNKSEFVIFVTPTIIERPDPADAELSDFLAMEESVLRDRSEKEYGELMEKKNGVPEIVEPQINRVKKRKWR